MRSGHRWLLATALLALGLFQAAPAPREAQAQEPTAQEAPPPQEVPQVPEPQALVPTAMTDEEEDALRLVEEILREQSMILAGQNFVYRSEGRRDPFRNLLSLRRRELVAPTERPPGLAGFLISEVQAKGTALARGRWHVLLVGLDQRTYSAEVGTVLYDGRIVAISENEVIFEQEIEDMLGARSTRQVIKKLDTLDQG